MDKQLKQCSCCGQNKTVEDFSKSYPHRCKECVNQITREKRMKIQSGIQSGEPVFIPIPKPEIDWEQRRYEIAKDVISAFFSKETEGKYSNKQYLVTESVIIADTLINELKIKNHNQ